MLLCDVGDDKRVKGNKFVTKLFRTFRCYFNNGVRASGADSFSQKFLDEKSAWHRHFEKIRLVLIADPETNRPHRSRFETRFIKNRSQNFHHRTFSFSTRYSDNRKRTGRKTIENRTQK